MDWPEGQGFGISPEEEVTCDEEAPWYNELPESEKQYALFTDGSCPVLGKQQSHRVTLWSPKCQVAAAAGEGERSRCAELRGAQLPLATAGPGQWPGLCVSPDSQMVADALWGWVQQRIGATGSAGTNPPGLLQRGKIVLPGWKSASTAAPGPKRWPLKNINQQVHQAAETEVAQLCPWQHKGELLVAQGAHGAQATKEGMPHRMGS